MRSIDGAAQALYGKDLNTIVNLIRGEAGSEMILRILRRDPASSQFEEHLIPVKRDQLYLKESALPRD